MKKNKFRSTLLASVASVTFALSSSNVSARPEGATALPSAPAIENMQEVQFIGRDELMSYQDIGDFEFLYEPDYISALVKEGKLPPIWERLPKKPLVFKKDAASYANNPEPAIKQTSFFNVAKFFMYNWYIVNEVFVYSIFFI